MPLCGLLKPGRGTSGATKAAPQHGAQPGEAVSVQLKPDGMQHEELVLRREIEQLKEENLKLKKSLQSTGGQNSQDPTAVAFPEDLGHVFASSKPILDRREDEPMPERGSMAGQVLQMIENRHLLESKEGLNTSSYVNVYLEEEELKAAGLGLKINLADQTVYPESFKIHNNVLNMVAQLWHCPKPPDFDESGAYPGAGTVGSTEACLLAGLCLKFRWRKWYAARHRMSETQVRSVYPNMIISTCFQACWEKFFRYMDVEPKFCKPSYKTFTITPDAVKELVDEKTIGVCVILGNHYGGQYDPIWDIDTMLQELNKKKGWQVGMHVDAASGGFVAPWQPEVPVWDFRLPTVLSISASGHKFGEGCCGTGWVVWRQRTDLSEHVAISVSYLGGQADSYTLNFSRPATGVYVQYYKFHRLGSEGYGNLCFNRGANAKFLRDALKGMTCNGSPRFVMLDAGDTKCLPVVTAMLNPALRLSYDDIDLQHALAAHHWYVSGYRMSYLDPSNEATQPLFNDMSMDQTMFRVVIKANVTRCMLTHLVSSIESALSKMDLMAAGYKMKHQGGPQTKMRASYASAC